MPRRIAFLLVLGLVPGVALAQNAIVPGALELYPNLQTVGVRLGFVGDANANASGWVEWRASGVGAWKRGADLVRIAGPRLVASVFWLSAGTEFEVRAVVQDPDGGSGVVTGTTRTRVPPPTVVTGRTWWVATTGSDSATGGVTDPLRTLQSAGNRAQPGDEIRVRPGVYLQSLDTPRSGTPTEPIHLIADGPGVVLDGSDPAMLRRTDWRDDGGGLWSVPYTGTPLVVCADSLQRLHRKADVAGLRSGSDGVAQGWAIEAGRLSVRLEDGSNPSGHVLHVARADIGIFVDQSDWRIEGFEVRYFGTSAAASGIHLRGANRCVVRGNHVHTNGGAGIWLRVGASENLVEANLCRDPRIGGWPWAACKAHVEELEGISMRGGRGNVVRNNIVDGTFDGIGTGDGETNEDGAADCDFHDNLIRGCGDDALEPEGISGTNTRIWRNRVVDSYSGCSIAPSWQGPEYVLYNTFQNCRRGAFKFSLSGTAQVFVLHNTVTSNVSGSPAVHPSGPYSNVHFRNNVLVGRAAAAVSDDAGESVTGCSFDGDLLSSDYPALFRWKGVNYSTLAALRTATGFEANGTAGVPVFVDAAAGDLRLVLGSPGVDAALVLPGINDGFLGAAPDCGAYETVPLTGVDNTPPARVTDLDAH